MPQLARSTQMSDCIFYLLITLFIMYYYFLLTVHWLCRVGNIGQIVEYIVSQQILSQRRYGAFPIFLV